MRSLCQHFRRLKIGEFESNNDLLLWTSDKCCRNHAEFLEKHKENKFQLVVVAKLISMFADVDVLDKHSSKTCGKDGKTMQKKWCMHLWFPRRPYLSSSIFCTNWTRGLRENMMEHSASLVWVGLCQF